MTSYILMLPRWYPNPDYPADGNFVQKHIECISKKLPVCVLFVKGLKKSENVVRINELSETHKEYHYYYNLNTGVFYWLINPIKYLFGQFKLYKKIKQNHGIPLLCHVHVLARSSILAYYLHFRNIPYVVSEHWSGYYKESKGLTWIKKITYRLIVKRSSANSAVSKSLANSIESSLNIKNVMIIPNIVDDIFFNTEVNNNQEGKKKIVHISNLKNDIKQTDKLLIALNEIGLDRKDIELIIIGDGPDKKDLEKLSSGLSYLKSNILFTGDIEQKQIAEILSDTYMTISFSKFETQSIVLLESMAMMVPIVAPNIGGIPEYASDYGHLFPVNSLEDFKKNVLALLDKNSLDRNKETRKYISHHFSCSAINEKFISFYRNAIPSINV